MPPPTAIDLVVQTVRTSNALLRASRRLFRPFGLSEAQFNVLHILQAAPSDPTQRELSDILLVDRSNVTGLLDRMAQAGWVRRMPVPGDRRAYRVELTPAGRALWTAAYPVYEQAARIVADALTAAQSAATHRGLAAMEAAAATIDAEDPAASV